jgi:hypothetical protein
MFSRVLILWVTDNANNDEFRVLMKPFGFPFGRFGERLNLQSLVVLRQLDRDYTIQYHHFAP